MKTKTNPLAVKDIEEIALRVRQEFNISEDTFFPIIDILEQLNNEGKLNLEVCEDSFLVDEYANYNPLTNTITVKESVYNESYSDIYRSNFTLAHEFFHYIQTQVLKFTFIEFQGVVSSPLPFSGRWRGGQGKSGEKNDRRMRFGKR